MIPSPYLLEAALPYISQVDCRKMYTNGFQYYVTPDKFCAGSQLGKLQAVIIITIIKNSIF